MGTALARLALAHQLLDQRPRAVEPDPPRDEHVAGPTVVQQPEQQVLGADEAVPEVHGLAQPQLQRLLGVTLERDVPALPASPRGARAVQRSRPERLLGQRRVAGEAIGVGQPHPWCH